MSNLSDFISEERDRFSTRDNNLFAFAFSQITRYQEFVEIVTGRYELASESFIKNTEVLQKTMRPGTHATTEEQLLLFEEGRRLTAMLHLEIESFYLFAKILLDRVARAIEFYFGSERSLPLDSHDDMAKNFHKYSGAKKLNPLPPSTAGLINQLKQDVSDYRDYEIAHEKSPRAMKATGYSHETRKARIISTKIYPTGKDQQTESKDMHEVAKAIEEYIAGVIDFLKVNQERTSRELKEK